MPNQANQSIAVMPAPGPPTGSGAVDVSKAVGYAVVQPPSGTTSTASWPIIAVGNSVAATSLNGTTWTSRTIPAGNWNGVTCGATVCVAVGTAVGGGNTTTALYSTDGLTWNTTTIPNGMWIDVAWNGFGYVAITSGAPYGATSPDGITWTTSSPAPGTFKHVVTAGTNIVVIGPVVSRLSTDNGATWTSPGVPAANFDAIAYNGSILATAADAGSAVVECSADKGQSWSTCQSTPDQGPYYTMAWSGTNWVAIGGMVSTTPNPVTTAWTSRAFPAGTYKGSAYYAAGHLVLAVGTSSVFMYSANDGASWTAGTIPAGSYNAVFAQGSGGPTLPSILNITQSHAAAGGEG
jgi:hypothetical protein